MGTLETDFVWKFMTDYDIKLNEVDSGKELLCTICKKIMNDPCDSFCSCQYCRKCITHYMSDKGEYCPGGGSNCKSVSLILDKNVCRSICLCKKILELVVKCPYQSCTSYIKLSEMKDHMDKCAEQPDQCPYMRMGCTVKDLTKGKLSEHMMEILPHSNILIKYIVDLEKKVKNLEEDSGKKDKLLETSNEQLTKLNDEMKIKQNKDIDGRNTIDNLTKTVAEMQRKIAEHENTFNILNDKWVKWNKLCPIINVDFAWNVNNLTSKELLSEPFYSNNYKFCLRILIYKDDDISFYCILMKNNSKEVVWPMKRAVTLSIINQETLKPHKSEIYKYDTYINKNSFNEPTTDKNEFHDWIGTDTFIKYSSIKNNKSIIVNDVFVVSFSLSNQ